LTCKLHFDLILQIDEDSHPYLTCPHLSTGQQIILFACLIVAISPLTELGRPSINLRVTKLLFFVFR